LARHVAKFNQKRRKQKTKRTTFLLGVPDTAERCTLGTAKKIKKNTVFCYILGIHPPHERPCGTTAKKERKKRKCNTVFCVLCSQALERKKINDKKRKKRRLYDFVLPYRITAAGLLGQTSLVLWM